ncbi:MAG: hypothetical protein LQ352_000876 [Teloschistes flavicans]|nr:MAG: hypothetical protein LQ352_000876 [Teloschistes flavicans]
MSVPPKYRAIGDFHEYYSGTRTAPYLTLFVGGNHEASNHLWELYYGGWVAPNIYYLGAANVINYGPLRIAGLSGIWKGYHYRRSHDERLPYGSDEVKSIYHVRELDTRKLLQLRTQVDIGISHDWPNGIEWKGDWKQLFRFKPHFEADAKSGRLGSVAAKYVMDRLRPKWWFAAHLHCKFSAVVNYAHEADFNTSTMTPAKASIEASHLLENTDEIDLDADASQPTKTTCNDDEIDLGTDDEDDDPAGIISKPAIDGESSNADTPKAPVETKGVPSDLRDQLPAAFTRPALSSAPQPVCPEAITNKRTHFLALDKCLPQRRFLQLMDVDPISVPSPVKSDTPCRLTYDKEWLAIIRTFSSVDPLTSPIPPDLGESHYLPLIEAEEAWVDKNLVTANQMAIPENFEPTAPSYDPSVGLHPKEHPREYTNPQTVAFCKLLDIHNFFDASEGEREERSRKAPAVDAGGGRGGRRGRGRGKGFGGQGRGRGRGYK